MKFAFLRQNWKWLLAPFLLMLSSGVGQTWFIAVFGEGIRADFDISHGLWGTMFMLATAAAAITMLFLGKTADTWRARKLALWVMMGTILACVMLGFSQNLWLLIMAIYVLRFLGGNMLMHISTVVVSRWFKLHRAKALTFSILGVVLAEATFPLTTTQLITHFGWRATIIIVAVFLAIIGVIIFLRLGDKRIPQMPLHEEHSTGMFNRNWTLQEVFHNWVFWVMLIASSGLSILINIFFFQLPVLAEAKGWTLAEVTLRLPCFSLGVCLSLVSSGILIDRFHARRFMAIACLPLFLGYLFLAMANNLLVLPIAFFVLGFGHGAWSSVGAVWLSEYYGTEHLGHVRAYFVGLIAIASSIGPMASGLLLDIGFNYIVQLSIMTVLVVLFALLYSFVSVRTKGLLVEVI